MIYKDVKLEKRPLDPTSPFYSEEAEIRNLGGYYTPDEKFSFYENLALKYEFDLRKQYLKDILELKRKFYYEIGNTL